MRPNYQPKNFPPSSQVFSQSDLPHNIRLWRFFVLSCFAMTSNTARWIKDVCSITWKILAQIWRTLKQKSAQLVVFTTRYAEFGGERGSWINIVPHSLLYWFSYTLSVWMMNFVLYHSLLFWWFLGLIMGLFMEMQPRIIILTYPRKAW